MTAWDRYLDLVAARAEAPRRPSGGPLVDPIAGLVPPLALGAALAAGLGSLAGLVAGGDLAPDEAQGWAERLLGAAGALAPEERREAARAGVAEIVALRRAGERPPPPAPPLPRHGAAATPPRMLPVAADGVTGRDGELTLVACDLDGDGVELVWRLVVAGREGAVGDRSAVSPGPELRGAARTAITLLDDAGSSYARLGPPAVWGDPLRALRGSTMFAPAVPATASMLSVRLGERIVAAVAVPARARGLGGPRPARGEWAGLLLGEAERRVAAARARPATAGGGAQATAADLVLQHAAAARQALTLLGCVPAAGAAAWTARLEAALRPRTPVAAPTLGAPVWLDDVATGAEQGAWGGGAEPAPPPWVPVGKLLGQVAGPDRTVPFEGADLAVAAIERYADALTVRWRLLARTGDGSAEPPVEAIRRARRCAGMLALVPESGDAPPRVAVYGPLLRRGGAGTVTRAASVFTPRVQDNFDSITVVCGDARLPLSLARR